MQKEEQQLEKRLSELSNLAYSRDIVTYSDFLNLNELNILHSMPKDREYFTFHAKGQTLHKVCHFWWIWLGRASDGGISP